MVAVAIRAVIGGKPLSEDDKRLVRQPVASGRLGTSSKEELAAAKKSICFDWEEPLVELLSA